MSTRQLRLNDPSQIRKRLNEFVGKKINIVLRDSTVMLAELLHVNDTTAEIVNMRLKRLKIPFADISEVYFDTKE